MRIIDFSEEKKPQRTPNKPPPPPEPCVDPSQFRCLLFSSRNERRLQMNPHLEMFLPILFRFHQQALGMRLDLPGLWLS